MTTVKALISLHGRIAIVTGATGHLGVTMTNTLAELGADLILVDQPGSDFGPITQSLASHGPIKVWTYLSDLERQEARQELIDQIRKNHPILDILINNAAFVGTSDLQGWGGSLEEQTVETWRRAIEVNLTAPFQLCKELAPQLSKSPGASIINIASIYGHYGPDTRLYEGTRMGNPAGYSASKGGLTQLTRWLSTILAPLIRVNTISPGGILRNQPESFIERYQAKTPLQRMATEDDFVGAIAFLATDLSRYVTGQNICVDGGWGVW